MTLFRTVAPGAEPVSVAEVKQHLRIDHASEDGLLEGLVRAAREEVEASTGLALIDQSWRLSIDRLPRCGEVALRRHPVRAITSVTIYGADGEASLVDPAGYIHDLEARPARLKFLVPLSSDKAMNGIEIDFEAGFGEAGTDVPDLIKRAILLLVAHWYEFRAVFPPEKQPVSFPAGYERLIAPYRLRRL